MKSGSILMRIYDGWRQLASKPRREQIDLCHFMRVILIFAPWRWFWQKRLRHIGLTPFLALATSAIVAVSVFASVRWPGEMLESLIMLGAGIAAIVLLSLLAGGVYMLVRRNPDGWLDAVDAIGYYGFVWLWWPAVRIARAARWFSRNAIEPAGKWLFTKHLFSFSVKDELVPVVPAAFVLLALIGVGLWLQWTLVAYIAGTITLATLVVIGSFMLHEYVERRASRAAITSGDEAEREPSVVWQWVVAKKHRICPLIEVKP